MPSPPNSIAKAAAATAAALDPKHLDAFLVHLNRIMSTTSGADTVLATVCYGARLVSVLLDSRVGRRVAAGRTPDLSKRLRALGSLMTELRMMTRLWDMLAMYVWGRQLLLQLLERRRAAKKTKEKAQQEKTEKAKEVETSESAETDVTPTGQALALAATEPPPPSTTDTLIAWIQLVSCIGFQMYENAAYLGQRGILPLSPASQASAYRWSSRYFCVYIAVELGRLAAALSAKEAATPESRAATFELQRSAMRYVAFAPSTVHWGMEKGFLGDPSIAILGLIPAVLQTHKVWTETAR